MSDYPALLMLVQKARVLNAFSVPELAKLARTSSPILIDSTFAANGSSLKHFTDRDFVSVKVEKMWDQPNIGF